MNGIRDGSGAEFELSITDRDLGADCLSTARHEILEEPRRHDDPWASALFGSLAASVPADRRIRAAFEVMRTTVPELFASLSAVTRRVVLFRDPQRKSFASFSAHGTAFLQVAPDADEIFFVEDLAHQCGHVAFNAMTFDTRELLAVDPGQPLRTLTGDPEEQRTVYDAVHGVLTEGLMSVCLHRCLEHIEFSARQRHELLGRLSFIMKRFSLDLANLDHDGLFQPAGRELYFELRQVFDEVFELSGATIVPFDLGNQPYAFDYDRFVARNPI